MQTLHLFNGEDAKKTQFPQFEQPRSYGFSVPTITFLHSRLLLYCFIAKYFNVTIHDQKNKNNLRYEQEV